MAAACGGGAYEAEASAELGLQELIIDDDDDRSRCRLPVWWMASEKVED